ncbi:MAG TPA: phosphatase PAP2 family protein [Candidatus Dormibacteraeota bacterium]|nr:phosphatase PAP2 family protein [Candidatus Dormibacteraeota bacterium]
MIGSVKAWSILAVLSAAALGLLLWAVLAHNGLTLADPAIATFVAGHRLAWLTPVIELVTWLGSSFFIVPFGVVVGGYLWRRRGSRRPLVMMAVAFLGAAGLYDIVKPAVGRARPTAALQVGGPDIGNAFPSGHATQTISFYGMLAVVLIASYAPRRRWPFAIGAALVALVVGASRLYLGVHWLTDVLGGYALGLAWLSLVMITSLLLEARQPRH